MALTKNAVEMLGARIEGHTGLGPAVRLPNGMLKTKNGLIIKPSTLTGDTRTGPLVTDQEESEAPVVQEEQLPVAEPVKKRRKKKEEPEVTAPSYVHIKVQKEGWGEIPTVYKHVYTGSRCVVLGMLKDQSYDPAVSEQTPEGSITNIISFSNVEGKYIYMGHSFRDSQGTDNKVLFEL